MESQMKKPLYLFWAKYFKFRIGDTGFKLLYSLGNWYIPLYIHLPNLFDKERMWTEYGVGILCLYLEWGKVDSLWYDIFWKGDDD